jgi:hypothetical protein
MEFNSTTHIRLNDEVHILQSKFTSACYLCHIYERLEILSVVKIHVRVWVMICVVMW